MTKSERQQLIAEIRTSRKIGEEWIRRYQDGGPLAADLLLRAHAPLVHHIAHFYSRPHSRDWADCIQEGRLGVLRGASDYNPGEGAPSTWLAIWIRHYIQRFLINHCQGVRIPVQHYGKDRDSTWRPRTRMFSEMPDVATHEMELAFEDGLVDPNELPDEELSENELKTVIPRLVRWFLNGIHSARLREVLVRRFIAAAPESLLAIGDSFGLSRERIRQLEAEGLLECRRLAQAHGFSPWQSGTFEGWVAEGSRAIDLRIAA